MIRNWRAKAKCLGDDPDKYMWDDGEFEDEVLARAERLCADCPVIKECFMDARMTINLTEMIELSGMLSRDKIGNHDPYPDILYTRGVIRGGKPF